MHITSSPPGPSKSKDKSPDQYKSSSPKSARAEENKHASDATVLGRPPDLPSELEEYLTTTSKPHHIYLSLQDSRNRRLRLLLRRFTNQILYGCRNPHCTVVTCLSYRKRNATIPVRPYNEITARALAWRCVEEYADSSEHQVYDQTVHLRKKGGPEPLPSKRCRLCWNEPVVPWYEDPAEAQRRAKNVSPKPKATSPYSPEDKSTAPYPYSRLSGPTHEKSSVSILTSPKVNVKRAKKKTEHTIVEAGDEQNTTETVFDETSAKDLKDMSTLVHVDAEDTHRKVDFNDMGQNQPILKRDPPKDPSSFTQVLSDTRCAKSLDQLPGPSSVSILTRSLVEANEPSKQTLQPDGVNESDSSVFVNTTTLPRVCTFRILPLSAIIWLKCAIPSCLTSRSQRDHNTTTEANHIRAFARQSLYFCLSRPLVLLESVQTWHRLAQSPARMNKQECLALIESLATQEKQALSTRKADLPHSAGIIAALLMLVSIASVPEVMNHLFAALQHAYVLPPWMKKTVDRDYAKSQSTEIKLITGQNLDFVSSGESTGNIDIDPNFLNDDQVAKICILITWVVHLLLLTSNLKMTDHLSHPEVKHAKTTGGLFTVARNSGTVFPHSVLSNAWKQDAEGRQKYQRYIAMLDAMDDWACLRLIDSLADVISHRLAVHKTTQIRRYTPGSSKHPASVLDMIVNYVTRGADQNVSNVYSSCLLQQTLLDISRTVLLRRWNREAIVKKRGPVGGALELLAALYRSKADLKIVAVDFAWKFVAESFDEVEMPVKWLEFREDSTQTHILSYSFLFEPAVLVRYFRAINSTAMKRAHESASFVYANARQFLHTLPVTVYGAKEVLAEMRPHMARFFVLTVRRNSMLKDAIDQIWRRQKQELMRPLKVRLGKDEGEDGLDHGGVQQEFFRLVFAEALSSEFGMFTIDERTRMIWFQPGSYEPSYKYEVLGILMSLAVYNGVTLPVTFPLAFYRKILGFKVKKLEHIADGWPDLAKGLGQLLEWKDGDVGDVIARTYEFSYDAFGTSISVDMTKVERDDPWPPSEQKKGKRPSKDKLKTTSFDFNLNSDVTPPSEEGDVVLNPPSPFQYLTPSHSHETLSASTPHSPHSTPPSPKSVTASTDTEAPLVTNANREQYVKDYVHWLTTKSISTSFSAFATGFYTCLDRTALSIFTPEHLKTMIEGYQHIDIDGLQSTTTYDEYHTTDETIQWFWQVVRDMSSTQHKQLLEFVTASDRVPVNGISSVTFIIQRNGEGDDRLPSSSTCYGRLLLPNYSKKEVLREKLEKAIENSIGFGSL